MLLIIFTPRSSHTYILTQLYPLPPLVYQVQFICPNTLGCEPVSGTWLIYQGVTLLKKTESPSPRSSQLPIAPKLGVELCAHLLL